LRKNDNFIKVSGKIVLSLLLLVLTAVPATYAQPKQGKKHKKKEKKIPPRSPKKAMLMALVPGMGQAYNHKYWKIPIVYAGFGVIGYFAIINQHEYTKYSTAYTCKVTDNQCTNPIALKYNESTLLTIRNYYRRNTQLSYIVMGAWYLLQAIDANVDAHLSHWDISDKLSVDLRPVVGPVPQQPTTLYKGIQLHFSF